MRCRWDGRCSALTTIALLAAVPALGCGTDTVEDAGGSAAKGAKQMRLSITSPRGDKSTRARSIPILGRVARGASVRVNGQPAAVSGRRFRSRQPLDLGRNRIRVIARKAGYDTKRRTVTVTRKRKRRPLPSVDPPPPDPTSAPTPEPTPEQSCHPSYSGACLDPSSYDYDCEGGSGDGPDYTGEVRVVGDDPFDLDRDGDGVACEP